MKRCWASLWTARAISYLMHHQSDQDAVALAVVVQMLVPADKAGILFTANPSTGRRDEILINAAWGLGEAIVGGKVTPDTITADKSSGKVKRIEISQKLLMTVPTGDGTVEQAVPLSLQNEPVLDEAGVCELVRLADQIEKIYQVPQGIEWCQAGDQYYIRQSRPITTLPDESVSADRRAGLRHGEAVRMAGYDDDTTVALEVIARPTEMGMARKSTPVKRVIAAVLTAMRRALAPLGVDIRWSDNDILDLIRRAGENARAPTRESLVGLRKRQAVLRALKECVNG